MQLYLPDTPLPKDRSKSFRPPERLGADGERPGQEEFNPLLKRLEPGIKTMQE